MEKQTLKEKSEVDNLKKEYAQKKEFEEKIEGLNAKLTDEEVYAFRDCEVKVFEAEAKLEGFLAGQNSKDEEWIGKVKELNKSLNDIFGGIELYDNSKDEARGENPYYPASRDINELFKNLLAENQEENHIPKETLSNEKETLGIPQRFKGTDKEEEIKSGSSLPVENIQEICENCGLKDKCNFTNMGVQRCKRFVPKKAEENKKEMKE
jgi:ribonuclease D